MEINDIRVTNEAIYDKLGWKVENLYACISDEGDFYLNGRVNVSEEEKGHTYDDIQLEACLCMANGAILDHQVTMKPFGKTMTELGFQTFTIHMYQVTRFCEQAEEIAYVELYPVIRE